MLRRSMAARGIAGLVCLVVLLSSCTSLGQLSQQGGNEPESTLVPTMVARATLEPTLPAPSQFVDAPALSVLVQSGILPPVEDRLPPDPLVVKPVDQVGTYGGTWHMFIRPYIDQAQFIRTVAYEPLVRWNKDWSGIEPNLAESFSVNEDSTEYTFKLRSSIRWSDGRPFSTADIRFWYEDVLTNEELTPVIPYWLRSQGSAPRFEFVDEQTFIVRFPSPNSLFLEELASPDGLRVVSYQAEYAKKYHAKYAGDEELQKMIRDGGYDSWVELFVKKVGVNPLDLGNFSDPKRPRLSAWVLSDPYVPGAEFVIWERNPYYWKVDPAGKQLPYIDTVRFDIVNTVDEMITRAVNGDIDMQSLSTLGVDTASLFGGEENTMYNLFRLQDGYSNVMAINLNFTNPDPVKRQIFRNLDFRIALSYAIDRQEIFQQIYNGNGKPWQVAPIEGSPFYDEEMGLQYTEYSVEKANEYLDRAGFEKDPLGNRLNSDGLPISFSVLVLENQPQQIAMLNLVARYFDAIGIEIQPVVEQLPIFMATIQSNLHDAAVTRAGATYFEDVLLNPSSYVPVNNEAYWAIYWAGWYNQDAGYNNPNLLNAAQSSMSMYNMVLSVRDPDDQFRLMKETLSIAKKNLWTIGIGQGPQQVGIAKKNFRNIPEQMPASWIFPDPGPAKPEQFYFEK